MERLIVVAVWVVGATMFFSGMARTPDAKPDVRTTFAAPDGGWKSADGGYKPPPACPFE